MPEYVFCDFEYNDRQVVLACFLDDEGVETTIDLRGGKGREALQAFVDQHVRATFVAYAAKAEMESFLRAGVDITPLRFIDLMAECSMLTGTHPRYWVPKPNLLEHLKVFSIEAPINSEHKARVRHLIITRDEFGHDDWRSIVSYCRSDVGVLPPLFSAIIEVHQRIGTVWEMDHAAHRGEYLKASALLEHRSPGLPVDADWIGMIFQNKVAICNALAEQCNSHYGEAIYRFDRSRNRYAFSHAGLEACLDRLPYSVQWGLTKTGARHKLDNNYLDELVKKYPELAEFKRTRNALAQLNGRDLRELVTPSGHVRPLSLPYYTKTGRNQPMAARGFLLNLAPWLRSTIRPHEGQVLVAADWSKQEIAIAAALSGDQALLDAYNTGDIYLALAKMAGAVPTDATAKSHPDERQAYKSVQLGLGYGMGVESLARSIFNDINQGKPAPVISVEEARLQARDIYRWHKKTFVAYWRFLEQEADAARRNGYTTSADGWFYFADRYTPHTRLMNYPMQANGAVMLREAV
ncbi:DNA polymerase, partial [Methylorubrum aminovorans]|uniref:DNA polymerase n=1 Tax=Methylorubrum aminovorans TaxID=269069 RepID=UPI003C2EEB0B